MTNRLEWLERQLDRADISDELADQYNREANEIQSKINHDKAKARQRKALENAARIQHVLELVEEGRMVELVETYGGEFQDDYTITDSFMVISGCFNPRNPNGQNCWQCDDLASALQKKFQLIYYRVYDHYVRLQDQKVG
jgi:hypothetical protein